MKTKARATERRNEIEVLWASSLFPAANGRCGIGSVLWKSFSVSVKALYATLVEFCKLLFVLYKFFGFIVDMYVI